MENKATRGVPGNKKCGLRPMCTAFFKVSYISCFPCVRGNKSKCVVVIRKSRCIDAFPRAHPFAWPDYKLSEVGEQRAEKFTLQTQKVVNNLSPSVNYTRSACAPINLIQLRRAKYLVVTCQKISQARTFSTRAF